MINKDDIEGGKDALAWTGHWWMPESPDKKLPGVLLPAGDRGPSLEIMGSFHAAEDKERKSVDIIHGITPSAEYVTLYDLSESASSQDARGQYRTRYNVELAVTGEHFASVGALTFQDLRIRYSTLVQWVGQPLIDEKEFLTHNQRERVIKALPAVEGRMYQGNGYVLDLHYSACWNMTGRGITLNVYPGAHIALHWDTPRPLEDTLAVVRSVRNFLAFATCVPTSAEEIAAKPVRFTRIGHAHGMLLFHRSLVSQKVKQEPFLALFSMKDVASNLETVVGSWFQKGRTLQPVIDLHLAPVYNPDMQAESQFLSVIQALEAFHRRMRDGRKLPEDKHAARMTEVLTAAPDKHRNWLKERLKYSNELGLRQRIKAVFDEFKDILQHFELKRKAFVEAVCNTRNYLTHYDPQLNGKAAKGQDLQQLVYGLQLLVDMSLLHECGIDRKAIPQLVARRHMALLKPGATIIADVVND